MGSPRDSPSRLDLMGGGHFGPPPPPPPSPRALLRPLDATRPHLTTTHPDLATQLDTLTNPSPTPPNPD
ncbi:hypothetical protein BLA24_32250 [Streptomyces cinnamoneus]|uniref:Uncharacterized protein n=1 Tax=Streptomyces cinnamoneus TaxID=53446 RepID=A0A2G1XA65_STRCJ|nr:hypothetical protein [Streptomyces cinnamoneus]PHQ48112.1 hypothetical protein BLA24_32250 [Streptomyces cinnamoneus]